MLLAPRSAAGDAGLGLDGSGEGDEVLMLGPLLDPSLAADATKGLLQVTAFSIETAGLH